MQRGLAALRDDERFGPWVYQIARSAILDHQRAAAKHRVADGGGLEAPPLGAGVEVGAGLDVDVLLEVGGGDRAVEQELASYLAPFVAALPSPYREALTLVELEGLTQKQAAEMLGISLSGMKSRVQRGRAQLRKALEDGCFIALDVWGQIVSCEPRPDGKVPPGCCS